MNVVNGGAPKSHADLVKEAREKLKKIEPEKKVEKVPCGTSNPCVWGEHNPNFNKYNVGN